VPALVIISMMPFVPVPLPLQAYDLAIHHRFAGLQDAVQNIRAFLVSAGDPCCVVQSRRGRKQEVVAIPIGSSASGLCGRFQSQRQFEDFDFEAVFHSSFAGVGCDWDDRSLESDFPDHPRPANERSPSVNPYSQEHEPYC
jgi:hypothetical protein